MAFLPSAFNARKIAPAVEMGALPAGEYAVAITESALELTKMGDGQFLKLVFTVLDGPCRGAKIWDRLNLVNRNPTAVDIAQRALSAICHAVGVFEVADSAQLHDRPLIVKINYVPPKGDYGEKNEVKAYKPIGGAASPAPRPAASPAVPSAVPPAPRPAASPAAVPPAAVPPWKRANNGSAGLAAQPQVKAESVADDIPF